MTFLIKLNVKSCKSAEKVNYILKRNCQAGKSYVKLSYGNTYRRGNTEHGIIFLTINLIINYDNKVTT